MFATYRRLPPVIFLLCLGSFVNRAGAQVVPFLALYLRGELGFSVSFTSWVIGAYGAGALAASLLGGILADRLGRRAVMVGALLSSSVVIVVLGMLSSPAALVAATFLFALFADMFRPAVSAMMADVTTPEQHAPAFALYYLSINLGFSFAPLIGGWLAARSFQLIFWADAITCTLFALLILITMKESRPVVEVDPAAGANRGTRAPGQGHSGLGQLWADKTFVLLVLAAFLSALVFVQFMSSLPLGMEEHGIDPIRYGQIVAVNGVMIVVLQLPVTSLLERFPRGRMLALSAILFGVGYGLNVFAELPWHFVGTLAIWTLGEIIGAPLSQAVISDLAPPQLRGRYMGVFAMAWMAAIMVGSPAGGIVFERWGSDWLWIACAITGAASAAVYLLIGPRLGLKREAQTG